MESITWFTILAVLGSAYCLLSYFEYRFIKQDDLKQFFKYKVISILIITAGVLIHTLGNVLGEETPLEMQLETAGHIIIMMAAVIIIVQSRKLAEIAKRYDHD